MNEDNIDSEGVEGVDYGTIPLPDDFTEDEAELSLPDVFEFQDWEPRKPATDAVLWRYIDFTQLVSILEKDSIWFNNVGNFVDPYEGIWQESSSMNFETDDDDEISEEDKSYVRNNLIYVSCWHLNSGESAALWEQYIEGDTGVAIRTTVGNILKSISEDVGSLTHGEVRYIDYENTDVPRTSSLSPAFHKRRSFRHENEFRLAFFDFSQSFDAISSIVSDNDFEPKSGYYLDVDVEEMIDKLHIAPTAPKWFTDLVHDVVSSYEQEIEIEKSDLYEDPVK